MGHFHSEGFLYILFDLLYPRIGKFYHFPISDINKMVMLFELIGTLKLCTIIAELGFGNQVAVKQQFNGIVQSCPADTVLIVLHAYVECLYVEMPFSRIDLL